MHEDPAVARQDVEALLEARRELGPSYDAALVDSFAERVERAVGEQVHATLAERQQDRGREKDREQRQFILGIVSLGAGIPITAISAAVTDVPGLIVAWTGIVGVNVAHALRDRRRR
jgi:hypothetical protein